MAARAPVEPLISVIPAPDHGPDVFTNENLPWTPSGRARGIFGGFLLGHAVRAAQLSADESLVVHSLQSTFVRAGRASPRFLYRVDRVSDGRTFSTRVVRAEQDGVCVFVATVGLCRPGSSAAGAGGGPRDLQDAVKPSSSSSSSSSINGLAPLDIPANSNQALLAQVGLLADTDADAGTATWFDDPFDWRHIPPPPLPSSPVSSLKSKPSDYRLHSYVRSVAPLSAAATPAHHLAALAFLTDEWLLSTANLAHHQPQPGATARARFPFALQTSLSHSVLFHDPDARADEWMVSERSTSWAADGRVLVEQRFWGRDSGRLVLTCWQEGLVRVKRAKL